MTFWEIIFLAVALVFILEGLGYALAPRFMRKAMMQLWEMPDEKLRLMGFVAIIVGLVVIWFIQG